MEVGKWKADPLTGKEDWDDWKYIIKLMFDLHPGTTDVIDGKLVLQEIATDATETQKKAVEKNNERFRKANTEALLIMTQSMTKEVRNNIRRFSDAKQAWNELHSLYGGAPGARLFELNQQFFSFRKDKADNISMYISKLKNIWVELKEEADKEKTVDVFNLLLIGKIMDTLPDNYLGFKTGWSMLSKEHRTVENLTRQLCEYERNLKREGSVCETVSDQAALFVKTSTNKAEIKKTQGKQIYTRNKMTLRCHYCKKVGHFIRECRKWIADGKPTKVSGSNMKQSYLTGAVATKDEGDNTVASLCMEFSMFSSESENDQHAWFIDNGATRHLTNNCDNFHSFHEFNSPHSVITAGNQIEAIGKGTLVVETIVQKGNRNNIKQLAKLEEVWYVPKLRCNLFSVLSAQDKNVNSKYESTATTCLLKIKGQPVIQGLREKNGGLYKAAIRVIPPKKVVTHLVDSRNILQLWHERMGHQNKQHVIKKLKTMGIEARLDSELCEGCIYGKAHRQKFGTRPRAKNPGEVIHADVCGPFVPSISGMLYYVCFKDDYTCYRNVYFMKNKSDVSFKLEQFLAEAKVNGHTVKTIRSDNGGEFKNEVIQAILCKYGIKHELTMPYTPQQNGSAERENRTLVEAMRSMMHAHGELPKGLWAEIIKTAEYVLNRTGPTKIDNKSPYELWLGKVPVVKHLRVIGSTCYAHVPDVRRKKLDKKAHKGILIGYDGDDGYRIWSNSHRLIRSRDVYFQMEPLLQPKSCDVYSQMKPLLQPKEILPIQEIINSNEQLELKNEVEKQNNSAEEKKPEENKTENDSDNEMQSEVGIRKLRDRSLLHKPKRYDDYVMSAFGFVTECREPNSYEEALSDFDRKNWKIALDAEMSSLKDNDTWELVPLPKGRKAISSKWVFKIKLNPDGTIDKHKARLVIKGCSQKKGIDYSNTFSPVAKSGTIRTVLSVAASENMSLMQFDVSTAFLYGKLNEEIYMKQPEGYDDGSNRVCRLKRSLYGLKQAPRSWNKRFSDFLIATGFIQSDADPCLYIQQSETKKLLVVLYVDDGLVAATIKADAEEFIRKLETEFKITTKPASYFLGIEIDQRNDGSIKINQSAYTKKILERFNMEDCNPAPTPIIKEGEVPENTEKSGVNVPYREAVGALMYLMVSTRPDIAYAVGVVSRKLEKPSISDWTKVKRIFRYLKGTIDQGINYEINNMEMKSYSDADHGGDLETGRSTSGVICTYAGGAISWLSQRQQSVAISTTEAEIVAASEAAREVFWLKRLLSEITTMKTIPVLQVDNEAAIRLSQNPEYHRRTKHIRTRHFFVRELVTEGEIAITKVSTEFQMADMMTKPLHGPRLKSLCAELGLS